MSKPSASWRSASERTPLAHYRSEQYQRDKERREKQRQFERDMEEKDRAWQRQRDALKDQYDAETRAVHQRANELRLRGADLAAEELLSEHFRKWNDIL